MAPTKMQKKADARPKAANKNNRVAKRPGRGFHRFRDGSLNLAPKSKAEKELVKQNQKSLLLEVPAELRSQIWEHVLEFETIPFDMYRGGHLFRPQRFASDARQTATLPFAMNTFAFNAYEDIFDTPKHLKPYQLSQIEKIEFKAWGPLVFGRFGPIENLSRDEHYSLPFLSGLKHICLRPLINPFNSKADLGPMLDSPYVQNSIKQTKEELAAAFVHRDIKIEYKDWS